MKVVIEMPLEFEFFLLVPEAILQSIWDAYWENEYLRVLRMLRDGEL